jgi:hypothetical protein
MSPLSPFFTTPGVCEKRPHTGGRQTSLPGLRERFPEIVADVPHRPSLAEDGFPLAQGSFNEPQLSQSSHA